MNIVTKEVTGQMLYNVFREAILSAYPDEPEWSELSELEQEAWEKVVEASVR